MSGAYCLRLRRRPGDSRPGLSRQPNQGLCRQRISSSRSHGRDRFQCCLLQGRGSQRSRTQVVNCVGRNRATWAIPRRRSMSLHFSRRSFLRGLLQGATVCVGIPILDRFLDGTGTVYADGTKLPVRFGTYFWGLGLTDTPTGGTRWVPTKTGLGYEIMPELESLAP